MNTKRMIMNRFVLVAIACLISIGAQAQTSATKAAPKKGSTTSTQKSAAKAPAAAATPAKNPTAVIHTTEGDLTCELYKDKVPNAVDNFVGLSTGTKGWTDPKSGQTKHGVPLYDHTIFHRVIPNFMIQGGDPLGSGMGGPGYKIPDEFTPDLHFDKPGVLAYANSGHNTNGSQFFITEQPTEFLNPCLDDAGCIRGQRQARKGDGYTIFGQCTPESAELVKKIAREPRNGQDFPDKPVMINHIDIQGIAAPKKAAAPAKKAAPKKGAAKKAPAKQ